MKVYVIGAGPAGMIAAITASKRGKDVVLLDKNEKTGKKLYITGKGRCNFTNCSSFDNFISNIASNPKFVYSALRKFGNGEAMHFIEDGGVKLKIERGNRVFPESDKSSDIIKAFNRLLKDAGVDVRLNETVTEIIYDNGFVTKIKTTKCTYRDVESVIIATGGVSYPATGSTGDGYTFAQNLGHTIIEPVGALTGLLIDYFACKSGILPINKPFSLAGISLKNVNATIIDNKNKVLFSEFGEMIFTDNGVSGPIILTLSSRINRMDFDKITLSLDLKPALSIEELDARLLRDFEKNKNKSLKNSLSALLINGLIQSVLTVSGINGDKKVNSLTKEERQRLGDAIKNIRFKIRGLESIDRAVVTAGGVCVKEIEPNTMRSKLVNNVYFAGEVIDIDAFTGGYNIQLALSTGYCAGMHA